MNLDTMGLDIEITGHLAAGIVGRLTNPNSFHLSIFIDLEKACSCLKNNSFTIGGQLEKGRLVTKINYPGDAVSNASYRQKLPPPRGTSECEFATRLLNAAKRFTGLDYSFPTIIPIPFVGDGAMSSTEYNSNSFVAGVIKAAGGIPPKINSDGKFQVPGYHNPIPVPKSKEKQCMACN